MADFETVTLRDPSSALTASFVPSAGMVGTSLADGGDEFLSQRRGLTAYVNDGKTMGIPILYPWANRLSANTYEVDGTIVSLTPAQAACEPTSTERRSTAYSPATPAGGSARKRRTA